MLIDLHSHTNQSDGSFSPVELIEIARRTPVGILAITDHDTFAGYEVATQCAKDAGVDLICGIEISAKLHGSTAHLLGYFPDSEDRNDLKKWIEDLQVSRQDRNARLVRRLRELGLDVTLETAEARGGAQTGRPHFAQILVEKGYAANVHEAFENYLGDSAPGYVYRDEPDYFDAIRNVRRAGGVASLAHPVRLECDVAQVLPALCSAGLTAIEAYHSDHSCADTQHYLSLADLHGLLVTGGSDFHGATKPDIELGRGRHGNLSISLEMSLQLVERLRDVARKE
jgi:predicted metal-dependent phosphoesterase TrpH